MEGDDTLSREGVLWSAPVQRRGMKRQEWEYRFVLRYHGVCGLKAQLELMVGRWKQQDNRGWLPLFDCCYGGCKARGDWLWWWKNDVFFMCDECRRLCGKRYVYVKERKRLSLWWLDESDEKHVKWLDEVSGLWTQLRKPYTRP